jgi:hypothetical protein
MEEDAMQDSDTYLGATESELRAAVQSRPLLKYVDQRRLFPHEGRIRLEPAELVLEGWMVIPRAEIADVRLTFTDVYRRSIAAGFRGQYTSFGVFGSLGKPLVVYRRDDEPVYLLIGYRWLTGTNQARHWAPRLQQWLAGERIA